LLKQYDDYFECDEECSDFSFAVSSNKINIEVDEYQFNNRAEVKNLSGYEINKVW